MSNRFKDLTNKIDQLMINKKYFVKIKPAVKKISYEENYHKISLDPDGKKRELFREKDIFLKNNKHIINYLKKSKPGKIIDLGCGMGWFMSKLNSDWEKYGIDISEYAISNAKKFCNAKQANIEKYLKSEKKDQFNYVISSHVIEHLKKPIDFLKGIKKILKSNGYLLLETPNFDSAAFRLFKNRFRLLNDPTHISLFTLDSLTRALRDNGFDIEKVEFPYFQTKYFNKKNLIKLLNYRNEKVSPPFYGSTMFFICKLK